MRHIGLLGVFAAPVALIDGSFSNIDSVIEFVHARQNVSKPQRLTKNNGSRARIEYVGLKRSWRRECLTSHRSITTDATVNPSSFLQRATRGYVERGGTSVRIEYYNNLRS